MTMKKSGNESTCARSMYACRAWFSYQIVVCSIAKSKASSATSLHVTMSRSLVGVAKDVHLGSVLDSVTGLLIRRMENWPQKACKIE